MRSLLGLAAAASILSIGVAQGALIHDYELNGNLNDSLGGPALNSNGGTVGAAGYSYTYTQGLYLLNGLDNTQRANYTIDMYFNITSVGKWNKILDFKNRTTDAGFYFDPSNHPNFYSGLGTGSATVSNGQNLRVTAIRDGTSNTFFLYEDGVLQFSFNDAGGNAIFDGTSNTIQFFEDEGTQGSPGEYPQGFVDRILIYDNAALPVAGVPEPSTLTMLAAGMVATLIAKRKRPSRCG
jgi:hypothetical protein